MFLIELPQELRPHWEITIFVLAIGSSMCNAWEEAEREGLPTEFVLKEVDSTKK